MDPATRKEVIRRLTDGAAVARVAKDLHVGTDSVRAIRDDLGIKPLRNGWRRQPEPAPVPPVEPDEVDGDPVQATPHRIPAGLWCVERPNQRQWLAMVAAANGVEAVALRHAMCRVLGLPLGAADVDIEAALTAEHRLADELAAAYIEVRGRGR